MTESQTHDGTHGYASVNGLEMYYEIHGHGRPLVLLHGALSATGTSFGKVLPSSRRTGRSLPSSSRHTAAPPTSIAP